MRLYRVWVAMHTGARMCAYTVCAFNGVFWLSKGVTFLFCWCVEVGVIVIDLNEGCVKADVCNWAVHFSCVHI